jgi:tetratricopeptide (TPR) repeat protein
MTSYLLYLVVACLVLRFLSRLLPVPIAIGAALLFAAHPVHVEAVALGVTQNELLVALLALLMVTLYLDRRLTGDGSLRRRDWAWLIAGYLLASLAKENGLILPGLLLAAEALLLTGPMRERAGKLGPGYLLLGGAFALVLLLRTAVLAGRIEPGVPADALIGLSIPERGLTMLQVVPEWARLLLWPARLSSDYAPQQLVASSGFGGKELLGFLLVAGAALAAWTVRRRAPSLSFGLLWMAIALLPVSNLLFPTGVLLAERTLFLPSIGLVLAVAGAVEWGWKTETRTSRLIPVYWSIVAMLTLGGVIRSAVRHRDWKDETTLAYSTVRASPRSWTAQMAYGNELMKAGLWDRGAEAYERSIGFAPSRQRWRSRNKLAEWYYAQGADSLAVGQLRQSLGESPDKRETWQFLILGYLALGDYPVAARLADSALAISGEESVFRPLRAVADTALRERWPPGTIRIQTSR